MCRSPDEWLGCADFAGPEHLLRGGCVQVLVNYSAAEVIWVQEEPENQGAWRYVKPRLDTAMRELLPRSGPHVRPQELCTLRYVGRPAAATPGAAVDQQ